MEDATLYLITALVAILGSERLYERVWGRRHNGNPSVAAKQDIKELRAEIATLNRTVLSLHGAFDSVRGAVDTLHSAFDTLHSATERHFGWHEGVRED